MKATSRIAIATVRIAARQYTDRRPESTQSRRPWRAPYSAAAMPYSETASASTSATRPANAISRPPGSRRARAVLRRALRDHRSRLRDEGVPPQLTGDDQLATDREGRRDAAAVVDLDRWPVTGAIGEPEVDHAVRQVAHALQDDSSQLHGVGARRRAQQLARRERRTGRGETRVDQAAGEHHRQRERNDQSDLSLAGGSHRAA